jgi:predicted transcriptional regulator
MAKIEVVKRPSLITPRHLLRYIFFTEMQIDQASKILNTLMKKKGKVEDKQWKTFVLTSRGLYVKVMRKLRDVGLVEKSDGSFYLSDNFSDSLNKLAESWSNILRVYEKDKTVKF